MADPLSIATAIAGLLTFTAQIASKAHDLHSAVKDAPVSISKIQEEMGDFSMIFCQILLFIGGSTKLPNKGRLTMISLHHLMATLSGCVLVCSTLDKKLGELAGLRDESNRPGGSSSGGGPGKAAGLLLEKIKWAL